MFNKKRAFNLIAAVLIMLAIAPFAILAYPFLMFFIGKPVIFKQERIGQNGQKFTLYKLRSMRKNAQSSRKKYLGKNEAPAPMFKITEDPRFLKKEIKILGFKKPLVIKIGQFLSRSGLDETPQLFNIIKGEMNFMGPRPLPTIEALALKEIDPSWYKWRHSVKPGVFSLWAADPVHNKSFTYWKKLEKESLKMDFTDKTLIILKIVLKQLSNLFISQK
jgi:lipopolysaccharide/colanic/teichoic acid biosynthesis glycosyltransferase